MKDQMHYTTEEPRQIIQDIETGKAVLLDVREQIEWDEGHLGRATLLPLSVIEQANATELRQHLPIERPIYCYCKAGVRSVMAAQMLNPQGFDVRALKEGYEELLALGF